MAKVGVGDVYCDVMHIVMKHVIVNSILLSIKKNIYIRNL